jgi:hypothetical protein
MQKQIGHKTSSLEISNVAQLSLSGGGDGGLSLSGPQGPVRRTPGRFIYAWCPIAAPKKGRNFMNSASVFMLSGG